MTIQVRRPSVLILSQAAEMLGVSIHTIRSWDKKYRQGRALAPAITGFTGQIFRIGRAVRVPADAVDQLIEKGKSKPQKATHRIEEIRNQSIPRQLMSASTGEVVRRSDPVDCWTTTLKRVLPKPVQFVHLTPGKSHHAVKGIFEQLIRLIRSDNAGSEPRWLAVFEPSQERGNYHCHALIGGADRVSIRHWKWRSFTRHEQVRGDGAFVYIAKKLVTDLDFDTSPGMTLR